MNIAYIVRNGFYPPFNGERVKSAALATALAVSGRLNLIDLGRSDYPGHPYPDGSDIALPYGGSARVFSMLVHGHPANTRRVAAGGAGAVRLSRVPLARRRAAAQLLAQLRPDVVVADHPFLAPLALAAPARLRVVHAHNVESQLAASMAEASGSLRRKIKVWRLRRIETRLLPRLDQVWAVSEPDAQAFRYFGSLQVVVTPNIIGDQAFAPSTAPGEPGHAAFFGWLTYPPNAAAAAYLLDLVTRQPEIRRLSLIGRGLPQSLAERLSADPRLNYLGYVEDLHAATASAAAILVPLAHGAGTKLKVLEALALGKPLLTTPIGAEGLNLQDGEHCLIREPGAAFDQAAVELLREPQRYHDLARRGQEFVREHYSQATLNRRVAMALGSGA